MKILKDFSMFVQILAFWAFVYLVMYPLQRLDRAVGANLFRPMVGLLKAIGNR